MPRGSAYRLCWQGRTSPSPVGVVGGLELLATSAPATWSSTWCALSRSSPENCHRLGHGLGRPSRAVARVAVEVANGSRSRLAWTPSRSVTRVPERRPRPPRRRPRRSACGYDAVAAPARRTMVGRGQRRRVDLDRAAPRAGAGCSSSGRRGGPRTGRWRAGASSRPRRGTGRARAAISPMLSDGEVGQQQGLPLREGQLPQRLEGGPDLRVEGLVAVPDPRGVTALGVGPGVRADPRLGVVLPRDLAPVVPGDDEGVADRAPGRRAGRRSARRSGAAAASARPCRTRRTRRPRSSGSHARPGVRDGRGREGAAWPSENTGGGGSAHIGVGPPHRPARRGEDGRAMTSLLSTIDGRASQRAVADGPPTPGTDVRWSSSPTLGGVVAAGSVLLVCLAIGVARLVRQRRRHPRRAPRRPAGRGAGLADGPRLGNLGRRRRRDRRTPPAHAAVRLVDLAGGAAGRRLDLGPRARCRRDRRRRARLDRPDGARRPSARLRARRAGHPGPGRDAGDRTVDGPDPAVGGRC